MEPGATAMHLAVGSGTTGEVDEARGRPAAPRTWAATRPLDDEVLLSPISAELPAPEDAWPPGTRVGRYELGRCIGAGGLGLVFEAFDPRLGRAVAIKLLRPERAAIADHRTRVLREAQAMAQVRHCNVVEVHDVGECEDDAATIYIVMELVDGQSLQDWLLRRPPWRAIVAAFADAARGLAAAHRRGVIHRDFKPTNAMIGSDGCVRVLDFGLARGSIDEDSREIGLDITRHDELWSTELTEADKVLGTPPYMAPEQHVGERVDARADQYALCVALFEALFGRRPFAGVTLRELTDAKLDGRLAPVNRRRVPAAVFRILERGLAPEPERRFTDMTALAAALDRTITPVRRSPLSTIGAAAVIGSAMMFVALLARLSPTVVDTPASDHRGVALASMVADEAESWAARAEIARQGGRLDDALVAASRALELTRAVHGEDHPANVAAHRRVAELLHAIGRPADGRMALRELP